MELLMLQQDIMSARKTPPSVKPIVSEEQRLLNKASLIFQAFRGIEPTMPTQLAYTFLIVATHPGISVSEVADLAGFKLSTASRHLLDLGERNRKKEPGFGLVEVSVDPNELRRKTFTLTPRGKHLLNQIMTAMKV